jgi:hypothetical protein
LDVGYRRKRSAVSAPTGSTNLGCSVKDPSDQQSPIGAAFEWVGRILAVVVEMVVPGLVGKYFDDRLGTGFLALVGFGGGLSLGIWHLIVMTRPKPGK